MTSTPFGKCAVCGRNVALNLDGTIRAHQATAGTRNAPSPPRCTGSNRPPAEVAPDSGPRDAMVYRCHYTGMDPAGCSWHTQTYSEVDAHEDQLDPGHLVSGEIERVES